MPLKYVSAKSLAAVALSAALIAAVTPALADEYQPSEFLGLDLSKAVLSPKPLGPPSQFTPVAVEAKGDTAAPTAAAGVSSHAASVRVARVRPQKTRVAVRHGAVGTRLAGRHGNPLDAQAFDTRIQVWPCRSGGICNWRPN